MTNGDVDADMVTDLPEFHTVDSPSMYENMKAIINLTSRLGDISNVMYVGRNCGKWTGRSQFGRRLIDMLETFLGSAQEHCKANTSLSSSRYGRKCQLGGVASQII